MKAQWINKVNIEGYVFSIEDNRGYNKLTLAETGATSKNPGTPYIRGVVNVATDEEGLNVVPVYFTYVTETFASGKTNDTFTTLKQLIDNEANNTLKTFVNSGTDAAMVRIDGDIEVNDWLDREGNMVASKRVRGAFVHMVESAARLSPHATFEVDMLISNAARHEVEEGDDYMTINGYAFNFRKDILPLGLTIDLPDGMTFFENQDISSKNPLLINLWGEMTTNVIGSNKTVESAFGAPRVESTNRSFSAWKITGCATEPMEWDDESTLTKEELKNCLEAREKRVQEEKVRQEERRNNKGGVMNFGTNKSTKSVSPTASDDFDF